MAREQKMYTQKTMDTAVEKARRGMYTQEEMDKRRDGRELI